MKRLIGLCLGIFSLVMGAASGKDAPIHERGWLGGEFKVVTVFPAAFNHAPKAAILVTVLNTNTPAGLAGIAAGDLILEANHKPATSLKSLLRTIDRCEPGSLLPVKLWREGEIVERNIRVGRETYNQGGVFMIGLPGYFYAPKVWPFTLGNAGFSVCFAGFKPEQVSDRKELSSAEQKYFKDCGSKNYRPTDPGWKVWLVILQAETNKRIRSQEIVTAETAGFTNEHHLVGLNQNHPSKSN